MHKKKGDASLHPHPHIRSEDARRPIEGHQALRGSTVRAAQARGQPGGTAAGAAFLRALALGCAWSWACIQSPKGTDSMYIISYIYIYTHVWIYIYIY